MGKAVDHSQVVDLFSWRVVLVCRPEAAIVLVEDEARSVLPFLKLVRHSATCLPHWHRLLGLDHLPELSGLALALEFRGGSHKNRVGLEVFRGVAAPARVEDAQSLIPQVLFIASLEIVDAYEQRVIHNLQSLQ